MSYLSNPATYDAASYIRQALNGGAVRHQRHSALVHWIHARGGVAPVGQERLTGVEFSQTLACTAASFAVDGSFFFFPCFILLCSG